ncbi:MAG: fructose-bisphosphate aldolase [Candidatus Eremiobacteraeota bacterium]|nr:fructose-bisphosphate aldolase [Candidatus Eremiobacteraeota bacterium]
MLASIRRPTFDDLNLSTGKRARLYEMMFAHGPGNGTLMLLPIDQGLEHGPVDFFDNPDAIDTDWVLRLAVDGNFSGIAYHIGLAEKYHKAYAGRVPLVLKINGKTNVPSDDEAFSPLTSSVEDAIRLGASAVGYTLYVGSPAQDVDLAQANEVRRECDRYGIPLIVWSYPRGSAVKAKGGQDSLYAVDYAARVACEIGADIVKLNVPKSEDAAGASPKPYNTLAMPELDGLRKVVKSAGRTLVLVSGGSKMGDEDTIHKARLAMEAGCVGLIFGRNMWQRAWNDAISMSQRMHALMKEYGE